jgi:predicted O-methyltransferase YrrM
MSEDRWAAVDQYIAGLFEPPDEVLDAALAASRAAGLPAINVSATQGRLLQILARAVGARQVLEIGTLGGYSTIWLARALQPGGRVVTLEAEPRHAEVAHANVARAGLSDMIDLRIGAALDTLPALVDAGRGPFDLIFIDAHKPEYAEYLTWALALSRPGTLIVADNIVRAGAVADEASQDANVQGVRRFNARLAAEPRVTATVVQTVGSKGYDGFALAIVNGAGRSG